MVPLPSEQSVTLRCQFCDRLNRVEVFGSGYQTPCSNCAKPILLDRPVNVSQDDFDQTVLAASIPVLVDFYADWCGPCKMMAPQFEAAARSLEPHVRLGKLDTEAEQQIAGRYGIRGIPTMILFSSGKEIARTSGAMPAAQIAQWARSHV